MNKIALLIVYNHRYDLNISKLENLYGGGDLRTYIILCRSMMEKRTM